LDSVIPGGPFQHPWVLSDSTAFVPSLSSLQLVSQPLALVFPSGCAAWLAGCLLMLEGCSWRKEAACFVPCLCGALFGGFQAGGRGLFVRAGCCPVTAGSVLASSVVFRSPAMVAKWWHWPLHYNAIFWGSHIRGMDFGADALVC